MRLPKWLYQFSFKCEPSWIVIFSLLVPLIGIFVALVLPALRGK
jgi:hypothetical protein